MTSLLKSFGKGCLYILVLPVLIAVLCVYAVLGVLMFIYVGIKGIYLFFTGRSFKELPEDVKARAILNGTDDTNEVVEEPKKEEAPSSNNDYASHYYVPLSQDIPAPKDEEPKEGGEQ